MLKPEQAREALKEFAVEGWKDRRLKAAPKLPEGTRQIAWVLLGRDRQGKSVDKLGWEDRRKLTADLGDRLDSLGAPQSRRLWQTLLPGVAAHVDGALDLTRRMPYQSGWSRKAFRAPNDPSVTRKARAELAESLVENLGPYGDRDIAWVATWAAHLNVDEEALALALAAAIDGGGAEGEAVFEILLDSARGTHEIAATGRHVTRALLAAGRPEGWEFVEKLLLAAQRQEGLRQSILESIDESHPQAFRRMLRLILEHDLARFSATVRALDVWLGLAWDSVSTRVVNRTIEQMLALLDDPAARDRAFAGGEAETAYLAGWCAAFDDAMAAVGPIARLLTDAEVERRYVGVHLLAFLGIPQARRHLPPMLDDPDLRVALRALSGCEGEDEDEEGEGRAKTDLFDPLERLLARMPEKPTSLKPLVWPWRSIHADRSSVARSLIDHLGGRSPSVLIPHLPALDTWGRQRVVDKLAEQETWDAATRETFLRLAGDSSPMVRESAVKALSRFQIGPEEAGRLEGYLVRKAGDLRRGIVSLLLRQPDDAALASADRLLSSRKGDQRRAGLELLRELAESGRAAERCRARAEAYRSEHGKLDADESRQLDAILDAGRRRATLDDALGLMDPAARTKPVPPRPRKRKFMTPAATALIEALDEWIEAHRETAVSIELWNGERKEELLGNIGWAFPAPKAELPVEEDLARLPLREVWETWWSSRPKSLRDTDGLEALRACARFKAVDLDDDEDEDAFKIPPATKATLADLVGRPSKKELRHRSILDDLLWWMVRLHPPDGAVDFLIDAVETSFAAVPPEELARVPDPDDWRSRDWRDAYDSPFLGWLGIARAHRGLCRSAWTPAHDVRLYALLRWMDEPGPKVERHRPELEEVLAAWKAGGAKHDDLLDQFLGPGTDGRELGRLTARKPPKLFEEYPGLGELVAQCRDRILEVELERGDSPTAASAPAKALQCLIGVPSLVRLLVALGKEPFLRGYAYTNESKSAVFSRLIRATAPAEGDTPEGFAAAVRAAGIAPERLIELAVFTPHWARFVEPAVKWPGLAEAVWWLHAHTKDTGWTVDAEVRESWNAQISERTALTGEDLLEGAVDVAWFHRVHKESGPKRWASLDEAAKYASSAGGHKRAQLFADAMLGRVKKSDVVDRIRQKRHGDSVRALGLIPLAKGPKGRDQHDLLERYRVIQEFLRTSKPFGAQRQASENRAASIGLANLARTAGYPDPVRLEWAMEAQAVADLASGPAVVAVGDVAVSLAIDADGQPELTVARKGKPLKSIPPAVKKDKRVLELQARKTDLKRQGSRMRQSLEAAMCRGDAFTGDELRQLVVHPVLRPMLERLILLGDGIIGYPSEGGQALRDHAGRLEPIKKGESLRLAHSHDLLGTGEWHLWQHECFRSERVQPFKQVFRELYVLTDAERAEGTISRRYAGHQVNPRQALALLGTRAWVNDPEEGVRRTFHDEGLSAYLTFLQGTFTPAEVEGLTLEGVRFSKKGEWTPIPLADVPPRVFSEVMRDVDLIVSVAHRGGVDPEASASTVEMRAALLRETCSLLGLANVRLKGSHALVDGQLAHYSVHMGSGVVHRMPGGAVCLVPVHAQHRGRLFLPFADDDPKTAEVLSKVLLLARDAQIQDPTLLAQLRA